MLAFVNEPDEKWAEKLTDANRAARAAGRHDAADYMELRAANDAIRREGVEWLFSTLIAIAARANRSAGSISIEREEPHDFQHRGANLVGSLIRLRQGVRCLTVEAGWTRTPGDGFMRGGPLAVARIVHFGMPRSNAELALARAGGSAAWKLVREDMPPADFGETDLNMHFAIFCGG